jgi:hypothetical protein
LPLAAARVALGGAVALVVAFKSVATEASVVVIVVVVVVVVIVGATLKCGL